MKLEDLLGKRVRYKGEEGYVVEGHFGERLSAVINVSALGGGSRHQLIVPESEWQELEILD